MDVDIGEEQLQAGNSDFVVQPNKTHVPPAAVAGIACIVDSWADRFENRGAPSPLVNSFELLVLSRRVAIRRLGVAVACRSTPAVSLFQISNTTLHDRRRHCRKRSRPRATFVETAPRLGRGRRRSRGRQQRLDVGLRHGVAELIRDPEVRAIEGHAFGPWPIS